MSVVMVRMSRRIQVLLVRRASETSKPPAIFADELTSTTSRAIDAPGAASFFAGSDPNNPAVTIVHRQIWRDLSLDLSCLSYRRVARRHLPRMLSGSHALVGVHWYH